MNEASVGEGHSDFTIRSPTLHFKANDGPSVESLRQPLTTVIVDSIGSVNFHPYRPTLLSVSGSRHFTDPNESQLTDDSDLDSEDDTRRTVRTTQPVTFDSSINVWDFSVILAT